MVHMTLGAIMQSASTSESKSSIGPRSRNQALHRSSTTKSHRKGLRFGKW